ncbi:hypothetical protein ACPCBX_16775 [Streptomyces tuirus]|nr:hypothetical protein [Streptomyces tuirus]
MKLTLFVVIGSAFGLFCIILGAREENHVLMGGLMAVIGLVQGLRTRR